MEVVWSCTNFDPLAHEKYNMIERPTGSTSLEHTNAHTLTQTERDSSHKQRPYIRLHGNTLNRTLIFRIHSNLRWAARTHCAISIWWVVCSGVCQKKTAHVRRKKINKHKHNSNNTSGSNMTFIFILVYSNIHGMVLRNNNRNSKQTQHNTQCVHVRRRWKMCEIALWKRQHT